MRLDVAVAGLVGEGLELGCPRALQPMFRRRAFSFLGVAEGVGWPTEAGTFGSLLIANPVSSPPGIRSTYNERDPRDPSKLKVRTTNIYVRDASDSPLAFSQRLGVSATGQPCRPRAPRLAHHLAATSGPWARWLSPYGAADRVPSRQTGRCLARRQCTRCWPRQAMTPDSCASSRLC